MLGKCSRPAARLLLLLLLLRRLSSLLDCSCCWWFAGLQGLLDAAVHGGARICWRMGIRLCTVAGVAAVVLVPCGCSLLEMDGEVDALGSCGHGDGDDNMHQCSK